MSGKSKYYYDYTRNMSYDDAEEFDKQEFGDLLGNILVDVIDKYGTGEELESND